MRLNHASLLVGAAVLGLGAFALPALAEDPAVHEMTIQLPGGGSETIHYTGDVAPQVKLVPEVPFDLSWPAPIAFGYAPSFVAFDRSFASLQEIAADLDRQMNAFWQIPQMTEAGPGAISLNLAHLPTLGPGSSAYSVVSETFGNNVCTRMTEITASPNGGKPKVVSRTSGNCNTSPTDTITVPSPSGVKTIAVHSAVPATTVTRTAL